MYYSSGNYEAFAHPKKPEGVDNKSAYLIGSGLAALTAACYLVRDGQMQGDHIHVFVSVPPKFSITTIVSYLKGITGRHLFMAFPEIKQKLWKGHLWNDSYFVESIGSTSSENIIRYIERQSNHCM